MENRLIGKTFVVTGATSGIGLAVSQELARKGAAVIGVGRSPERCRAALESLRSIRPESEHCVLAADLSLQSEIRSLAARIRETLAVRNQTCLDGLVNNAGAFTYWLTLTAEGFETQWAVNHLAPFLLTHELLSPLEAAPAARVVTVSSGSHYPGRIHWEDVQHFRHYNCLRAYEQSKLANVLFTAELNRRRPEGSGVRAFAADPGLVKTEMGWKCMPPAVRWIWTLRRRGGVLPGDAARGIVFLLEDPAPPESGSIYWKDGQPVAPSRLAGDAGAAGRLWDLSRRMCGLAIQPQGG
jgi:NAD(P)-dependent dehydrogenase (short-subunit alcohol dehydrogenase family)